MRWYLFFLLWAVQLFPLEGASSAQLNKKNINTSIEEMLKHHVEYQTFSPLLAKRSLRVFFEQFDSHKRYLLQSEVDPFWSMGDVELQKIVEAHRKGSYGVYEQASKVARFAVKRARDYRAKIRKEILQGGLSEDIADEASFSFSKNELDLKGKLTRQMLSAMRLEKELEGLSNLSYEEKVNILDLLERRLVRLEEPYMTVKKEHFLALHTLKAVAKSLDAHTAFFSPEEAFDLRASLEKEFEGIGIVLREGIKGVIIKEVVKGGPAERSGQLTQGDLLIAVDGKSTSSVGYQDVMKWLKGGKGEEVTLAVQKAGGGIEVVVLVREKVVMEGELLRYTSQPYADGVIGVIEVPSFYESSDGRSCEKDMKEALRHLRSEGKVYGLVLDMRNNSGGFLSQAVKVAGLFVSSGVIVISQYSQGQMQYLRDVDGRIFYEGPLVVLTSKASASATEIVAQALQDYGIALVVGDERTYGKGTIQYQTVTNHEADTFFKVTVGKYYTVSGRSTQIEGVIADLIVPTKYAPFNIGEKYLSYALKNDQVSPAYLDTLSDVDSRNRGWMQKNYLPNLQKKLSFWTEALPVLKLNSEYRLNHDKNFLCFLEYLKGKHENVRIGFVPVGDFGKEDLQVTEAINIVKDMSLLQRYEKKRTYQ